MAIYFDVGLFLYFDGNNYNKISGISVLIYWIECSQTKVQKVVMVIFFWFTFIQMQHQKDHVVNRFIFNYKEICWKIEYFVRWKVSHLRRLISDRWYLDKNFFKRTKTYKCLNNFLRKLMQILIKNIWRKLSELSK